MIANKTFKKWASLLATILILLSIVSCLGIRSQIKHHNGAHTERIDPSIFNTPSSPIAISNVQVLSTDCTVMRDSLTVLIADGQIIEVAKTPHIPTSYKIIDGTGKFLIPGLTDTHVHLVASKNDLLLYLANGITHISEMFGNEEHLQWREEEKSGALSPKIYVATKKIGSKKGLMPKIRSWFGSMPIYNKPSKVRKAVSQYKVQGYDAIKLSGFLDPPIYEALIDEANQQDIAVVGHLPYKVGLKGLYQSTQKQLAHIEEITKNNMLDFGGLNYHNTNEYLAYLNDSCDSIAINIKKNDIVVTSTIWIIESIPRQQFALDSLLKNIKLKYANPGIIEGSKLSKGWLPGNNHYENLEVKGNPEAIENLKLYWKTYVQALHIMTKALIRHDVSILAGTDANATAIVPGFSLHDELKSLSEVGMSNSEVLYAATVAPAQWMQSKSGRIEAGYEADMLLLEKNPLEDIYNTSTIDAVISNGMLLNRDELDKILQAVETSNNNSRKISINDFTD